MEVGLARAVADAGKSPTVDIDVFDATLANRHKKRKTDGLNQLEYQRLWELEAAVRDEYRERVGADSPVGVCPRCWRPEALLNETDIRRDDWESGEPELVDGLGCACGWVPKLNRSRSCASVPMLPCRFAVSINRRGVDKGYWVITTVPVTLGVTGGVGLE